MSPDQIIRALLEIIKSAVWPNLNGTGARNVTAVLSAAEQFIAQAESTPAPATDDLDIEVEINE